MHHHRRPARPAVRRLWTCLLAAVTVGLSPLATAILPAAATPAHEPPSTSALIGADDPLLHYAGRWDRAYRGDEAATVNSGSSVTVRFTGDSLTGLFDISTVTVAPQLWVTVDGQPRQLVTLDASRIALASDPLGDGEHTARVEVKDTDQVSNRWLPELASAVVVSGFELGRHGHLLRPHAPELSMAFFGDSIMEGIRALGTGLGPADADGTRTYANLSARAFGADIVQVGFGKTGVMRPGVGNVPSAPESLPWNFAGSPADPSPQPDVVVLLEGSNDSQVTDEQFAPAYRDYLAQVRSMAPAAWIIAMEPLIGRHATVIREDVAATGDPKIAFVPTAGWLDRHSTVDYTDTVHPTVAGHLTVASHLVPLVQQITGLRVEGSPALVSVPPVSVPPGEQVSAPVTVHIASAWAAHDELRGRVVVDPPPGFTVDPAVTGYHLGHDCSTDVQVTLRGRVMPGSARVTGLVRVLVEGQTEALPVSLIVSAAS